MKIMWPQVDFCSDICITYSFKIKKKIEFQKFCPCGFLCHWCQQNFEILLQVWILTPNTSSTKCPRCMTFTQAIVFQPYFMKITTSISIWLQLSHNGSSKLLKNFSKSSFFGNFKLPLWIFQNKLWFLVNLHHSLEHYEAWKEEASIWSKSKILLHKKMWNFTFARFLE